MILLCYYRGLPKMFGVAVYAFMCHHSLPSIVTPIKDKSFVGKLMGIDLLLIYLTYILLNFSAMFAFGAIDNPTCDSTPGKKIFQIWLILWLIPTLYPYGRISFFGNFIRVL